MNASPPKLNPQCWGGGVVQGLGRPTLAVKEFCFMPRGICGGFCAKFLLATDPGNRRTKIGEMFRQIFATCFAHVGFARISLSGL